MTWKLRKKDSRCASISVTKEQEVWGEYGIYTTHKHTYLFKLIHKRHLKAPKKGPNASQKQPQTPPATKKSLRRCRGQKKTNFGRPGPIARAKMTPKWTSKRDQEHQNPRSTRHTKKTTLVVSV